MVYFVLIYIYHVQYRYGTGTPLIANTGPLLGQYRARMKPLLEPVPRISLLPAHYWANTGPAPGRYRKTVLGQYPAGVQIGNGPVQAAGTGPVQQFVLGQYWPNTVMLIGSGGNSSFPIARIY